MGEFNVSEVHNFEDLHKEILASPILYDKQKIKKSYDFAYLLHKNDIRYDGTPMIQHLLTVAAFVTRIGLDSDSIAASLLHETLDHKKTDLDTLSNEFGDDVAFLVDGLTDIKSISSQSFSDQLDDHENFRKLIISSTDDVRVLVIRLANKLHDAFHLNSLPLEKRERAAKRMINLYAPLCEFLGLGAFHSIFQDKSFEILNPQEYNLINNFFKTVVDQKRKSLDNLSDEIKKICVNYKITEHSISFRTKGILSTYNKIKRKYLKENEILHKEHILRVKDILGLRIIVDSLDNCYAILGIIHSRWNYDPHEFDDYILKPKESGYRSIHTVINYEGMNVEVQIRTLEMHEYNEFGPASHIAYKLVQSKGKAKESFGWTKELASWRSDSHLEKKDYKIKLFSESIFVFTPKGKVIVLPKNATPLDFAFRLHTELGCRYAGAKVNEKMVDMQYSLKTGDVVEILLTKNYNISKDWVKKARSSYAKKKIRSKLRLLGKWYS